MQFRGERLGYVTPKKLMELVKPYDGVLRDIVIRDIFNKIDGRGKVVKFY
jgi:hypothetical protein